MNTEAAIGAARRLSVDVANLSYRLALSDSANELILDAAASINPDSWHQGTVGSTDQRGPQQTHIILTAEQASAVSILITLIRDVL